MNGETESGPLAEFEARLAAAREENARVRTALPMEEEEPTVRAGDGVSVAGKMVSMEPGGGRTAEEGEWKLYSTMENGVHVLKEFRVR